MVRLLELCKKHFGTSDLYEILGIPKNASDKDVKKAYHKLSLKVHPDRVKEDEKLEATEKFKVLSSIHSIISDGNKRTVYDETGAVDEEDEIVNRDWVSYWRLLFKKVTDEDIQNYEQKYIGSEEELQDLKKAYLDGKGDMDYICDHVQYTCAAQEPRVKEILNNLIEKGEIPSYKIFSNEPEKKRKRRHAKEKKEAAEAEKVKETEKVTGIRATDELTLLIKGKQEMQSKLMDSFLEGLAAKYGSTQSSKPKSSKRKAPQKTEQAKKRKTKK